MPLSNKEKIDKFIEGAKLTATTSWVIASPEHEVINRIVEKHGTDKWLYYATVASRFWRNGDLLGY